MSKSTFKILFYLRKNQVNKDGTVCIMIRLSLNGEISQFSSKLNIKPDAWDTVLCKAKGNTLKARQLNETLEDIRTSLKNHYRDIEVHESFVTVEKVRNAFLGITAKQRALDEKTPHIHATVIPIVTGERRKAEQEEQNGKKKYRKKNPQDVRLCADDVMARHRLKHYQDTYAQAMNKYGLQRGVDGSLAKHISTMQYYKQLVEQQDSLQENIENLLGLEEEAMKKLKQVKGEINVQKMKGAAVNATTAIADGVSSLFGGSKVKRLEAENENLKRNIVNLQKQVQAEQREQTKMENRHSSEINRVDRSYRQKIAEYDNRLELIDTYFPIVKELIPIAEQCREVGFTEELTRRIVSLQPVEFKGRLYSKEYKEKFRTEHSTATVERNPQEKGKFRLCIDGIPILDWFRKKFQEIKEKLGLNTPVENKQRKGLKI